MFSNNDIAQSATALGARLREQRLARNDTQAAFAARVGVSIPTLRDMEAGSPKVGLGIWLAAFWMLGRLGDVDALLASTSLFDDPPARRRARPKP